MRSNNTHATLLVTLLLISSLTHAQNVGIQFYQGVNKPLVSFSGDNGTLDYKSDFNSEIRIGVFFGNFKSFYFMKNKSNVVELHIVK